MKRIVFYLLALNLVLNQNLFAQNVVITDDNAYSPTSTNALLEVKPGSNDKGILIPRLTTAERTGMTMSASNDKGLMVYDTDTKSFWYYDGTSWVEIGATSSGMQDADGDTKIQVEESIDEDNIRFDAAGTEAMVINESADVGIGITPSAKLHIKATNPGWDKHIRLENISNTDYVNILFDDDGLKFRTFQDGYDYYFRDNDNNNNLVIKDGGDVGIGTGSPANDLTVNGDVDFTGSLGLGIDTPSAKLCIKGRDDSWYRHIQLVDYNSIDYANIIFDNQGLKFRTFQDGYDIFFRDNDNNNNLVIKDGGNVGIGTAIPSEKLEVTGKLKVGEYVLPEVDGTNNQQLTTDGNGNVSWSEADQTYLWSENSGNIYRSSGNVGIGTDSPSGVFEVFQETGSASESIDQQSLTSTSMHTESTLLWQSFTAGSSGYLSKIDLWDAGSSTGTFSLKIYEGQGVNGALLSTSSVVTRSNSNYEYVSFIFPDEVNITSSQQYTFAMVLSAYSWHMDIGSSNPYSGGIVYYSGYSHSDQDTRFKTYVTSSYNQPSSLIVKDNGYVGIGTINPDSKLHAVETADDSYVMHLFNSSGNGGNGLLIESDGGGSDDILLNIRGDLDDSPDQILIARADGRIGIGVASPSCPLEVSGYTNIYDSYGYLNNAGNTGSTSGTVPFSIKASDRIMASVFCAVSDQRIKTNIKSSLVASDLQKINRLRLVGYNYIDSVSKGNQLQKGFIAQEVENVIPEAVNISSNFIPDIFVLASEIKKQDEKTIIKIPKKHKLQKGDILRLITNTGQIETEVLEILSDQSFAVKLDKAPEKIFVYGKKVDDFRSVDYDYIFSTGIGAIQELSLKVEKLERLKVENDKLRAELENLKSLKTEVAQLKAMLTQTASKN